MSDPSPPDKLPLDAPVARLHGIGAARAARLTALGLVTLRDLLEYYPRRYQFESHETGIDALQPDQIHTVRGEIVAAQYTSGSSRGRFEATLDDGRDRLSLTWFNGTWLRGRLTPGMTVRVRGKVGFFRNMPQMVNPQWQAIDASDPESAAPVESKLRPIYPATADLSSAVLERTITSAIQLVDPPLEWFDPDLLASRRLMSRAEASFQIHNPRNHASAYAARRRLVYDELMLLQVGLQLARQQRTDRLSAPIVRCDRLLDERIRNRFPFPLTRAQERACYQLVRDMQSGLSMNRLLQGDVGSGKTVVALYAMLVCVANKLQSVILAPTEVLAEQHHLSLSRFLAGSGVRVGLFTQRSKKAQKTIRDDLASGNIHLAVGTQALIQDDIDFANLGLVVIDEQHRFGVRQRAFLKAKGLSPHYLVMTATPIPRTLALSYFADFDVSTLDELPPGRQPIHTEWLRKPQSDRAWNRVIEQAKLGHQAYVVVPRIDGNGFDEDTASLEERYESLRTGPLKSLRLGMLHGRMKPDEKAAVMDQFRTKNLDVLCATTVIEVGVDVPNATVMVIESAEQFGLAQLHQLRGRVGRGADQSYCLLISDAPTEESVLRLEAMTRTGDGFELAEEDLRQRGPGDFFGTRQSGLPDLKVADLSQELDLLKLAREDAQHLLSDDPNLQKPGHRLLHQELLRRFGRALGLGGVG